MFSSDLIVEYARLMDRLVPVVIVTALQNLSELLHCYLTPVAVQSFLIWARNCDGPIFPANESDGNVKFKEELGNKWIRTFASCNSMTCTRNSDDCLLNSVSFCSNVSFRLNSLSRWASCARIWSLFSDRKTHCTSIEWKQHLWKNVASTYSSSRIRVEISRSKLCRSSHTDVNWSRSTCASSL